MYWKEPYHKDKHDSGSREHSLHQDIFQLCNYINPHKMTDFKQLCQIKISVTQIEQEEEKKKKKGYRKLNSLLDINFKMTDYIFFTIIHFTIENSASGTSLTIEKKFTEAQLIAPAENWKEFPVVLILGRRILQ